MRAEIVPGPAPLAVVPVGHQYTLDVIMLLLGWILLGCSLRGACMALAWLHETLPSACSAAGVPDFTTVRFWLLRLGYYKLHRPKEHACDWVWIVDHSNQVGQEKCFALLGIRQSQLPPVGEAISLGDLEVIDLEPVIKSDKHVVYRQLEANAAKTGVPSAILNDHGGDLAGGVELFRQAHPETRHSYDITHKSACLLKAILEADDCWKTFAAKAGQTKCQIQQTQAAHLMPPAQRLKARYMNLGPLIRWGAETLKLVDNPPAEVLKHCSREMLEAKLGWLREYRQALFEWEPLQQVIDMTNDFMRTHGYYQGAAQELGRIVNALPVAGQAAKLRADLIAFVEEQSALVKPGERLPASSEVIETSFGKFKTLLGDYSRSGFTGLLLAYAAAIGETSCEVVRDALEKTKTTTVLQWIKDKLGDTFASKRKTAYQAVRNQEYEDDPHARGAAIPLLGATKLEGTENPIAA